MEISELQELPSWVLKIMENKLYVGSVLAASVVLWKLLTKKTYNLPPGPRSWDVFTSDDMEEDIKKLKTQHGDIIYINAANPMVILASYKAVKEAFVTHASVFSHRPSQLILRLMNYDDEIFAPPVSEEWTSARKFGSLALRQFGSQKAGIEEKILVEVDIIISSLNATKGQNINCESIIRSATANIIHQIMFGERYDYDDIRLGEFASKAAKIIRNSSKYSKIATTLPDFLWKILNPNTTKLLRDGGEKLIEYVSLRVMEHRESFDPNNIRDFVDIYIQANQGQTNVDWNKTIQTIMLFLPDAVETLSQGLLYIILYLGTYTDWQRQLQDEVDEASGNDSQVTLTHKPTMSKTEAFLMEVLRSTGLLAQSVPHCCHETSKLCGYDIPKQVPIVASLYNCLHDPTVFPRPDEFDPSRFLDAKSNLVKSPEWIPFGIGKRMCMGDQLVKMEMLLITANLLKNFNINFPENEPSPTLKPLLGVNRFAQPFSVKFTSRL